MLVLHDVFDSFRFDFVSHTFAKAIYYIQYENICRYIDPNTNQLSTGKPNDTAIPSDSA